MKTTYWQLAGFTLIILFIIGCSTSGEISSGRTLQKRKYTKGWFVNKGQKVKTDASVERNASKSKEFEPHSSGVKVEQEAELLLVTDQPIVSNAITDTTLMPESISSDYENQLISPHLVSTQKASKTDKGTAEIAQRELLNQHSEYSSWIPMLYFLLALVYPVMLRSHFPKKMAAWARDHKKTSLVLLLCAQLIMLGLSFVVGSLLGITVSPWLAALGLLVFVLALLLNERSAHLGIMGFRSRMTASVSMSLSSGFAAFSMGSNGLLSNWRVFTDWSFFDGFLRVTTDTSPEMPDDKYIGLIILMTLALFVLLIAIAVLTCVLTCTGNEVAALVVVFGAVPLILLLFITQFKRINRKFDKQLEQDGRDPKIRKKLFAMVFSITLVTMIGIAVLAIFMLD